MIRPAINTPRLVTRNEQGQALVQEALDGACREMVVIIRPSFKKLCEQEACRAALFNHLLYWIAQKAKGQEAEQIKSGEVYWYGSHADIWSTGLARSWSMWKVRKELKALVESGLIGQRHNQVFGWDREYQYFFGEEQGATLRHFCEKQGVNLHEIGLCDEVLHVLKTAGACAENSRCIRRKQPMHVLKPADASAETSRAIPKDSPKGTTKDSTKRECAENPNEATHVAALTPMSPPNASEVVSASEIIQKQQALAPQEPEEHVPVPPTTEDTGGKASEKPGGTTGKTSAKLKGSQRSSVPPSGAVLLLDAWDQINGRSLTRTKDQIEAACELARINASRDDLRHVRDRLLAQKDGFWRSRGVSLKNIANNFHLAALGPIPASDGGRTSTAPPVQSTTSATQSSASAIEKGSPRKLLRRAPSATQAERLAVNTPQEGGAAL